LRHFVNKRRSRMSLQWNLLADLFVRFKALARLCVLTHAYSARAYVNIWLLTLKVLRMISFI
jgi:hypothetical protein